MRHPSEGVLRRLLDEPAGVSDADRRHVAGCAACLAGLAAAREDAALAGAALRTDRAADADPAAAWQRLSVALPARPATPAATTPAAAPARRRAGWLHRPAAAVLAAVVVLSGAGVAAATDWLPIFRTEQVAPLEVSTDDLVALPDLTAYGDVAVTGDDGPRQVADAAAAEAETGLDVPGVGDLPTGVEGEPAYAVVGELSGVFTFSAEKAAAAASASGEPLPPLPAGLDGAQVRLTAGPGVAAVWTQPSGLPSLVVGRAVAPQAFSSGVPFETVQDYLLSLPGLPEDLAAQLRGFTADGSTLPIPVPADLVETSAAEVGGLPATVLESRDQALAAVVWVEDGVVTLVGGSLGPDEVLDVAAELR
ncbi:hypothetical protein SAMN06893096_103401 [Geodermatophilus pulveris]|uniref:DUF4367 domain-containing protein n=1 Tax=Geodermatophilus pulveris TaxID=1564159 RepID=A0A239DW59_9ACTN|nr:hypothetical protein [Geodermatophilus pulveris]SNS36726.1 hypothetical protein SAMN06893096_103401 [Geodermatophilus pulveris]